MTDPTPTDPDRHPVDLLAEEFAERCRRGDHPSVSDYVRRHPQVADKLREVLPPIVLMEKLKVRNTSGNSTASAPLKLQRLGDFRIVREIGRGGMGIVYEAWQESLERHVALKVLSRFSTLDPQRLQRFEREARAAAGLHHTHIVPVFGVGESDGLHYFAMQFIQGRSLAEILSELSGSEHPGNPTSSRGSGKPLAAANRADASATSPLPIVSTPPRGRRYWRWVADAGRQVAEALEHAHRQGVLHRDVKPANLLLDGRGTVWVTDFGLAKLAERNDMTRSGDVIGTLQYMAPEGLRSQADVRSDVYSLGLTLYELLTLRPAFSEETPAALMRRIAEGGALPPTRINAHIPRDLETIVLKATSRDAKARYATAGELAEDLENFLHDRPLSARRASNAERLWRWCRRNRAISALAGTAAVCAIAAIVVGWVAYGITRNALNAEAARARQATAASQQANAARQQADAARQQAEAARHRADQNVALSLASFEDIFNRLAPRESMLPPEIGPGDPPPPRPQQRRDSGQDASVLQSVLSFYDKFALQNSTSRSLQLEAAKSYRRVGELYTRLGRAMDADAAHRRSVTIFNQLLLTDPNSLEYQAGFVDAATWIGYQAKTQAEDATILRRASQMALQLQKSAPHDLDYAALLARALFRQGVAARSSGDLKQAEQLFRSSAAAWIRPDFDGRRPARRFPPPKPVERAAALEELAELLLDQKRIDEARAPLHQVFDELQRPSTGPPHGPADGLAMADMCARLSKTAARAGESDLSHRAALRAGEIRRDAGDSRPDGPPGPPPDF
jgi:serine/threonine protein kinase